MKLDQFDYIIPKDIEKIEFARNEYIKQMENSQKSYNLLVDTVLYNQIMKFYNFEFNESILEQGYEEQILKFKNTNKPLYNQFEKKAIEDARYVFPNACETKIIVTMNVRSLLNFFSHRCCDRAQSEIREMAFAMLKECKKVAPILFKNAGASCVSLGYCKENSMSCGRFNTKNEVLKVAKDNGLKVCSHE